MKKKRNVPRLSAGELEILSMLWECGPLCLAEAHRRFGKFGRPVSYPTMQTRLNRLVEKEIVSRTDERPATYAASVSADSVGRKHLDHLFSIIGRDRLVPLVAHLISERRLTAQEVKQLKQLLADTETRKAPDKAGDA